jgi:hypothetical protein
MAYVFETTASAPPWVGLAVAGAATLALMWLCWCAERRARQWERAALLAMRAPRADTRTRLAPEYHAPKASDPLPQFLVPRPWVRRPPSGARPR